MTNIKYRICNNGFPTYFFFFLETKFFFFLLLFKLFFSGMSSNNKQAKRRLKQLGATLNPSKAGWSDSEDDDLRQEGKK